MGEAHLAGTRAHTAADHGRRRGAVMRRAKRRRREQGPLGASSPATEWMRVTSSASSRVSAGSSDGSRRASIVLPVPGGPARRTLCSPAAAISSARRPRSCPRTSARSGPRPSTGRSLRRCRRLQVDLAAQVRDGLGEMPYREAPRCRRAQPRARTAPRTAPAGSPPAPPLRPQRSRPSRADTPVEGQLAEAHVLGQALRAAPAGRRQAARARSAGRSPCLPCAAPPARG